MTQDLHHRVLEGLAAIRPYLQKDQGDIALVEISGDTVKVELLGACRTCDINSLTMRNGVATTIREFAPEIKHVHCINESAE